MNFVNTAKVRQEMGDCGEIPAQGEIIKNTIHIAWPSVLESFSVNLAGMIDIMMVGSLGTSAIAAVGLTSQPKMLALGFFFALNTAVSSIVARRKGEENREGANQVLRLALLLTIGFTIIIAACCVVFAHPIISFAGSQPDTHEMAVEFYRLTMLGILFTTISMVINSAQRGAGNTRISLVTNVLSTAVKTILNLLLISGNLGFPALGIRGAAIATVIGQAFACLLSIRSIFTKTGFIQFNAANGYFADKLSRSSMVKVGGSALVEQVCLRVGFLLFVKTIASLGTTEMAAHQIGMNMMSLTFSIGDGFSIAAVTLIGQSLGQKRPDLAKLYGSTCQRIGLCCAGVISIFYILFGRDLFALFDTNPTVLDYGVNIMRILSVILFLQIAQVVQFGCLRGAGDTRFTAAVSLISVTIIRPGMSWLLCYPLGMGLIGAWLGTGCDQVVRFLLSYLRFRSGKWTKLKL